MKQEMGRVLENDDSSALSLEVEQALEKEIGRAEISASIDALLEEGYQVKSPEEIIELMEPFIHDDLPEQKPDQ